MKEVEPPPRYRNFAQRYPEVLQAYEGLGQAVRQAGPLDDRTRRLVRLGIAVGARLRGAVHAHTRLALAEGIPAEEIRQVAVLAITTLGLPQMMAALEWVEQELERSSDGS
ncbi:MAG: carboxymuconolactone decarboxylase family protein [Candidatus Eremiobacterota bacterium]